MSGGRVSGLRRVMLHDIGPPDRYTIPPPTLDLLTRRRRLLLTFDDGYASVFEPIAALSLETRSRVVVFPVAGRVGGRNDWDSSPPLTGRRLLDWGQLAELATLGVSIGSHGMTHADLRRCTAGELDREVRGSKSLIEERLGRPVPGFCYPFGYHSPEVERAVERAGYSWAVTTDASPWRGRGNPFRLRRITVRGDEPACLQLARISPLHDLAFLPELPLLALEKLRRDRAVAGR